MKKFLAKLALFSITSIIVTSLFGTVTLADATGATGSTPLPENLVTAFKDLEDPKTDCIQEEGDDNGYIITIIEEPLSLEQSETKTPKADFESRICFRNYLSYVHDGKEKVISMLSKKCADTIEKGDLTFDKKYNVKFSCKPVQVLLSKGGTSLIEGYIATIYKWAASIVGVIATAVIIISAVQISIAGGDTQAVENAKNRILKSISGIVILFLSGIILYTINPTFFTQ
jgi:hypothetical protein